MAESYKIVSYPTLSFGLSFSQCNFGQPFVRILSNCRCDDNLTWFCGSAEEALREADRLIADMVETRVEIVRLFKEHAETGTVTPRNILLLG
jgi:hypothetical protein